MRARRIGAQGQPSRQAPPSELEATPQGGRRPPARFHLGRWARLSLDLILDLLYPRPCAICGRRLALSERCLCLECASRLPRYHEEHTCASERLLGSPLIRSLSALSIYHHDEDSHRLITSLKYSGYRELAPFIIRTALSEGRLRPQRGDIDLVLPVPIEPQRLEARGYNQAMLLAEALAAYYGCPARADYLGRYRGSHSQTRLHRQQRMLNAQRAFYLNKAALQQRVLQDQRVLLVDDLLTTGSTLHALCDLLEEAGVAEVHVFVAAVAIRAV